MVGEEYMNLYRGEPLYEFCEYPDGEYRENGICARRCDMLPACCTEIERVQFPNTAGCL